MALTKGDDYIPSNNRINKRGRKAVRIIYASQYSLKTIGKVYIKSN
jgi:hypothetical protein